MVTDDLDGMVPADWSTFVMVFRIEVTLPGDYIDKAAKVSAAITDPSSNMVWATGAEAD